MNENKKAQKFGKEMEGEGNKTADKQYREAATEHAQSGKVEQEAKKAEHDIDENPAEYDAAAKAGKERSAGDLLADLAGKPALNLKKS